VATALPTGVYKRGSSYYIRYRKNGKWKHRSAGPDLPGALELHEKLRTGKSYPPDVARFHQLVERYIARQRIYSKPKSVKNARHSAARLLEYFGKRPVCSLGPDDLDRFVTARLEKVKPKSANGDLIILRAILNQALNDGKIDALPFKVKLLRAPRKKVLRILSKDDIRRLLQNAHEPYYGILFVAASTGFRADEILHLQWSDVRPHPGQLSITSKDGWTSKSYEERAVYVPDALLHYLTELRRRSAFSAEADWVFPSRNGTPLDIHRVSRNVRKIFERAGLYRPGEGTLHLIRHSVASRLLQEKVDLETVREILGHSLLSTTALYIHSTSEAKRAAARTLELL
jgi:integrase